MHFHSPSACCQNPKSNTVHSPIHMESSTVESAYVQLNLFAFQINDCYFYLDEENLYAYYDERMTCCFSFYFKTRANSRKEKYGF